MNRDKILKKLKKPDLVTNAQIYNESLKTYLHKINNEFYNIDGEDSAFLIFLLEILIFFSLR